MPGSNVGAGVEGGIWKVEPEEGEENRVLSEKRRLVQM